MPLKRGMVHVADIIVLKLKQKTKIITLDSRVAQFIYMAIFWQVAINKICRSNKIGTLKHFFNRKYF